MSVIRAFVFDFDGLILDTETSSYETAREIYAEHGVELTVAQWQQRIGTHGPHWLQWLEDAVGPLPERERLIERRRLAHLEQVRAEQAMPGVARFVADAARRGIGLAVASSSSSGWVTEHLDRLGLMAHFAFISTCENGVPPKPAPDVYRRAVEALGVEPGDAVAFEDSPNGIAAAKAAGLVCIAVPNRMTGNLDLSAADHVVASFEALDLDEFVVPMGPLGSDP